MGSLALSIQSINSYSLYMRSETPICSTGLATLIVEITDICSD
jgi:hypothetical protein